MASTNLLLDADRLWGDVMALAEITDPERPYTRRSFSPLFLEGRAWLAKRFADAGLAVRIDTAGNLIGRLEGADPSLGAVRRIAEQFAVEGADYFVATVGILSVEPGASNVVPGRCRLVIDARTTNPALTRRFIEALERESAACAAAARVERAPLITLSDGPPVACDPMLREVLRRRAREFGLGETDLASGAGHDAAFMSRIGPSAMIFVPCRNGKSHAPEEWADREAIARGAAVVLQAVKALDRSLPRKP